MSDVCRKRGDEAYWGALKVLYHLQAVITVRLARCLVPGSRRNSAIPAREANNQQRIRPNRRDWPELKSERAPPLNGFAAHGASERANFPLCETEFGSIGHGDEGLHH